MANINDNMAVIRQEVNYLYALGQGNIVDINPVCGHIGAGQVTEIVEGIYTLNDLYRQMDRNKNDLFVKRTSTEGKALQANVGQVVSIFPTIIRILTNFENR